MKPVSNPTLILTFWLLHSTFLQCKTPRQLGFALFSREAIFGGNITSVAISATAGGNVTSVALLTPRGISTTGPRPS